MHTRHPFSARFSARFSAHFPSLLASCVTGGVVLCLAGCGGGSASSPSTPGTPTPAPTLARLFAPLTPPPAGAGNDFKYLKVCYFPTQQFGTTGQSGIDFIESLVLDKLPTPTAPIYHAQNGQAVATTNRAYKGSDPVSGAPPVLWTGVATINTDGSASGFGAPCTPTDMLTAPGSTCYWLAENNSTQSVAVGSFIQLGDARPQTSSGTAALINPGWGTGAGFYFWYEMSFGPSCSAPGSKIIARGQPKS